jgi:hypothetical protein
MLIMDKKKNIGKVSMLDDNTILSNHHNKEGVIQRCAHSIFLLSPTLSLKERGPLIAVRFDYFLID